ncbi:efflux RND transporter periplasmic adaptor subunit [Acinetobacter rathckeae]|uniref:efflux RND transporter periplasmic adaptor subunit n=1 Tax=Acinetobacter rathckeae TaxID=2605272 RepID=UPI0018A2E2B3|nr:efflux RND transporter periplasmic adaptor subunit [Acinetobacter rathckeae]MBF7687217.1 efflux RND transporter periplasmic adaptor subunit [Acinetobacter rathckeae]MBF7694430.1 efflux RND transporter periplasmic adaptor subunit [Acinetobacter rathckeae]
MNTQKKRMEWLWVLIVVIVTICIAIGLFFKSDTHAHDDEEKGHAHAEKDSKTADEEHDHKEGEAEHAEEAEESIHMTLAQATAQGVQFVPLEQGQINAAQRYPAKVVSNLDQQAHLSSGYAGRVEQVDVALGQRVKKGQILATIYAPELIEQQANLDIAVQNLALAKQDYLREKTLFDQGISARQDYLRANNAFKRAEIEVQALQSKFKALGLRAHAQGRYAITSPIEGVVSKKDLVVGEYVQMSDQLLTIDQTGRLWLEFVLPSQVAVRTQQKINFQLLQSDQTYQAVIKNILPEADATTGQLKVQAEILDQSVTLKPNVMANVWLASQTETVVVPRIAQSAVQQVEGETVVFVVQEQAGELAFKPQVVELGLRSSDEKWVEVKSGLTPNQRYVTQGSFVLKSELEKSEADHAH